MDISITLWVSYNLELAALLEAPGVNLGDYCLNILFPSYQILLKYHRERKRIELRGCALYLPTGRSIGWDVPPRRH